MKGKDDAVSSTGFVFCFLFLQTNFSGEKCFCLCRGHAQCGLLRQKFTLKPATLILRPNSPDSPSMLNDSNKVSCNEKNEVNDGDKCQESFCVKTESSEDNNNKVVSFVLDYIILHFLFLLLLVPLFVCLHLGITFYIFIYLFVLFTYICVFPASDTYIAKIICLKFFL